MQHKTITAPIGYPFFGWDEEAVKKYIESKPLSAGDQMIIYNGQAGFHSYSLAIVVNPASGRQRRVILSRCGNYGGTSFYRSGKNCYCPKGQTKMIPPVPQLMEHLILNCDVILDLLPYS